MDGCDAVGVAFVNDVCRSDGCWFFAETVFSLVSFAGADRVRCGNLWDTGVDAANGEFFLFDRDVERANETIRKRR